MSNPSPVRYAVLRAYTELLAKCLPLADAERKQLATKLDTLAQAFQLDPQAPWQTSSEAAQTFWAARQDVLQQSGKPRALKSVFEHLGGEAKAWQPTPLQADKLPSHQASVSPDEVLRAFVKDVLGLPEKKAEEEDATPLDNWGQLLRRHLSHLALEGLPPAISIYEHYKESAAILSALALADGTEGSPLLLASFDISGIQGFLYDIANSKAYRSLKGRSFYIYLLLHALIEDAIDHFHLGFENVVYASGGKAYMLFPNSQKVRDYLDTLERKTAKALWASHKGSLYIGFAQVPFGLADAQGQHFRMAGEGKNVSSADLWQALSARTSDKKRTKYLAEVLEHYGEHFATEGQLAKQELAEQQLCAVTGWPVARNEAKNLNHDFPDKEEVLVSPDVYEQSRMGRDLRDCVAIISAPSRASNIHFETHYVKSLQPLDLHRKYFLVDESELKNLVSGKALRIFSLNAYSQAGPHYQHLLFYGGNVMPLDGSGDLATLEDMVAVQGGGQSKLGVLRMDVDNLGKLFSEKMRNTGASLALQATLSARFDHFFSGYLNHLREETAERRRHVALLYAGGDDVFALGRWDQVLDFAMAVRRAFADFTQHPDIGLSAGLSIVGHKFPIYKAAELAGEAEKAAKRPEGKDSINFFGQNLKWGKPFAEVERLKKRLLEMLDYGVGTGLLQQLQRYHLRKEGLKARDLAYFDYKWHAAYYLRRIKDRYKNSPNAGDIEAFLLKELSVRLMHDSDFGADAFLDMLALAARWAEMERKLQPAKDHASEA